MGVKPKVRFEVLKECGFRCFYCGASPRIHPNVYLQVDHVHPRAKGGKDERGNLVASCVECNSGKSDFEISYEGIIFSEWQYLTFNSYYPDTNVGEEIAIQFFLRKLGYEKVYECMCGAFKSFFPSARKKEAFATFLKNCNKALAKNGK